MLGMNWEDIETGESVEREERDRKDVASIAGQDHTYSCSFRPSTAALASSSVLKVTNPNPRARPVSRSRMMICSSGVSTSMDLDGGEGCERRCARMGEERGGRRETHGVSDLAKLGEGLAEGLVRGVPRQVSRERKDQLGDARSLVMQADGFALRTRRKVCSF